MTGVLFGIAARFSPGMPPLSTALRDTPAGIAPPLVSLPPWAVRSIRSEATWSLDAPEDLPKQAPRQVTLGQLVGDNDRSRVHREMTALARRRSRNGHRRGGHVLRAWCRGARMRICCARSGRTDSETGVPCDRLKRSADAPLPQRGQGRVGYCSSWSMRRQCRCSPVTGKHPRGRRKSLLLHLQLEVDRGGRILGLLH